MICFFGYVELHSTDSETHENDIDESDDDDEELAENNDNSNISEFSVELSDTDQKEQKSQSDFKDKKHVGVCTFMVNHVVAELTGLYLQNTEQIVLKQVRMIWT